MQYTTVSAVQCSAVSDDVEVVVSPGEICAYCVPGRVLGGQDHRAIRPQDHRGGWLLDIRLLV